MTARTDPQQRLKEWLDASLANVAPGASAHIHVDQLVVGTDRSPRSWLDGIKQPYLDTIQLLSSSLMEVMPVLVIPLNGDERLDCRPPDFQKLESDLSDEPPSIYLVHRDTARLPRRGELYRCSLPEFTLFEQAVEDVAFFFETWRSDREKEDGWEFTRTILGEHYGPVHRTGWHSRA